MDLRNIILSCMAALALNCAAPQTTASIRHNGENAAACTEVVRNYYGTSITFCQEDNSDVLQERLDLIGRVKRYGRDHLGLLPSQNYLRYVSPRQATERRLFMLYATPEFVIPTHWEPSRQVRSDGANQCGEEGSCYLWSYGVDDLHDEGRYYDDEGYDTYWRSTTNFGSGANITDELFAQEPASWISTVFHEDFHYMRQHMENRDAWDPWVEESLASAFGSVAALGFIRSHQNDGLFTNEIVTHEQEELARRRERAAVINDYTSRLRELYQHTMPDELKRGLREDILQFAEILTGRRMDNAFLWCVHPYTNLLDTALFVYLKNPDIEEFADIMRNAPMERDAARDYLVRHGGRPALVWPYQNGSGFRLDDREFFVHTPWLYE